MTAEQPCSAVIGAPMCGSLPDSSSEGPLGDEESPLSAGSGPSDSTKHASTGERGHAYLPS